MKNRILKTSKPILSIVIAFSLLAMSMFTGVVTTANAQEGTTDTWDGSYSQPTTKDTDGTTILISTAEELAWVILQSGTAGAGVTYKVADDIKAFYMNENTADLTLAQVKNNLNGNNKNAWECQGNAFQGTLDGNGVTIYGLYSAGTTNDTKGQYGALVPTASGSVTVKNLAVKNSCIGGYLYGAAIIGYGTYSELTSLTVEKCVVTNNYIHQTRSAASSSARNYSVGVIGGAIHAEKIPCSVKVDNCLIYGNELYSALSGNISATIARFETNSDNVNNGRIKISNLIISGAAPWCGNYSYWGRFSSNFSNIYTDTDASGFVKNSNTISSTYLTDDGVKANTWCTLSTGKVAVISTANMKGEAAKTNMPNFAWDSLWKVTDGDFPSALFIKETAEDSTTPERPEGAWDGEEATTYAGGDGTEANPFIIENAAQLYKMVKSGGEDADGNPAYFKVKDGVYDIYANPVEDMTSEEIKAYFKNSGTYKASWDPQTTKFNGNFDGNGVTIHGLYNVSAAAGTGVAFLPKVSGSTAIIQNVEFKDCYFENTAAEYSYDTAAAIIVGVSTNSAVTMKNIAVCDSTAICRSANASVFFGRHGSATTIDTAFTSGNTLVSEHYLSESFTYCYEGILYGDANSYGTPLPSYTVKNSVFTEADEYLTRVHYNISVKFENTYTASLTVSSITGVKIPVLSQSDIQGAAAKTNMPDLDWNAWVLTDSYPVIEALHDLNYTPNGDSGHSVTCGDCDVSVTLDPHAYDSNYKCTLCGFAHSHTLIDTTMDYDATCVDSGIMNVKCEYCDYTSTREICAKNHEFGEVIPAAAGDCQTEATVAYKTCSRCELNFATTADITSKEPLDHIGTGYTARHDWVQQEPIMSTCSGVDSIEYFQCSVCDTYLVEGVMTDTAPSQVGGHVLTAITAQPATCVEDGNIAYYDCENCDKIFSDAEGETEIDSIVSAATGHKFGTVIAATAGDCKHEGTVAYKECSVCGKNFAENAETNEENALETISNGVKGEHILEEVKEVPATTEKEGTKAHYICTECKKLFSDADGKTEVSADDLVIEKLVEEDTDDNTDGNTEDNTGGNTDNINKPSTDNSDSQNSTASDNTTNDTGSPKTGDNVSVIWLVLLLAAVISITVITEKTKHKA